MANDAQPSTLEDFEIANLNVLNFGALESADSSEVELLLKSCIDDGFFYLDFANEETSLVLEAVQGMYSFMKDYFRQPMEVKMTDYTGGGQWG